MILTILLFIAMLAILIIVHEFGHFITAKKSGARVEEFGIGFPPRVFGIKRGETLYSLNLFPIGGFVKIYGEDGASESKEKNDPRSFSSKSIGMRSFIIVAGVLMNILLAVVLLSFGHFMGLPQAIDDDKIISANVENIQIRIVGVAPNSPAQESGIQDGDAVIGMTFGADSISNLETIKSIQNFTNAHLGENITISLKRGGEFLDKEIIPRKDPPENEGPMGIAMMRIGEVSYPFYLAPIRGIESTIFITIGTLKAFGGIISGFVRTGSVEGGIAGPVGIAVLTGQMQRMGFVFLLQFMALISINLAIINILPFPALDGGRLLFLGIEKIKGSPVNQKYEKIAHTVGFALLILLMIVVTVRDVGKFL